MIIPETAVIYKLEGKYKKITARALFFRLSAYNCYRCYNAPLQLLNKMIKRVEPLFGSGCLILYRTLYKQKGHD
jgi:hypothetical protein